MSNVNDHIVSAPSASNQALRRAFSGKDDLLASIPNIPSVLRALLDELNQPADKIDLVRVCEIIGRDEALAARCLRMANSALFNRGPLTDSLRSAVRTLGIARTRDIALSCGLMQVVPRTLGGIDPLVFWQHSLGCAIVSRKLAKSVGYSDPEKAYLAGLMHDIGYIVNLVVLPKETQAAVEKAQHAGLFLGQVEQSELGFSHCESGEILARQWALSESLTEVILCHHDAASALIDPALVAMISLADRLCRASGLGVGYSETESSLGPWESDWAILSAKCPLAKAMSWNDFAKDAANYLGEIQKLVAAMYKGD